MIFTAAGSAIRGFDLRMGSGSRPSHEYDCNTEEINQLAVHPKKGNILAACDDDGEIQLIDLEAKKPLHRLHSRHENICTTVVRLSGYVVLHQTIINNDR
jgi:WD40 repeat protein